MVNVILGAGPQSIVDADLTVTDPDDATQLTDGKTTSDYFWTQKGTVGWQRVQYATVTVDLTDLNLTTQPSPGATSYNAVEGGFGGPQGGNIARRADLSVKILDSGGRVDVHRCSPERP